jgi:hypothetical protein
MMKTLKILIAIALVCIMGSALAQSQSTDSYAYQANPSCEFKITVSNPATSDALTYRLTFNLATPTQGTVDPGTSVKLRLPKSSQWYELFIEHTSGDDGLYTIETGCDTSGAATIAAPNPVITESQWATAQERLKTFIQQINAN